MDLSDRDHTELFERKPYRVSELVSELQFYLEERFFSIEVEGEISEFRRPGSGHYYFSLKDEKAKIKAVMFKQRNIYLKFKPENGQKVLAYGRVTVYEPNGEMQLKVEYMEPIGAGDALIALRILAQKLEKEGLFAAEYKVPLPAFPMKIGVVTSPSGAAIKDFLKIIRRRFSITDILIFPAHVQGENAVKEMIEGLKYLDSREDIDLIVLTRGGGSPEDLMPFNDERLARAIFNMTRPTISAVGHEIDTTIADLVADYRAPTPSAAAEIIVENMAKIIENIEKLSDSIVNLFNHQLIIKKETLKGLSRSIIFTNPYYFVNQESQRLDLLSEGLLKGFRRFYEKRSAEIKRFKSMLGSLNPLAVLERGFSITFKSDGKTVITASGQVSRDEEIITRLSSGGLKSKVLELDSKGITQYKDKQDV